MDYFLRVSKQEVFYSFPQTMIHSVAIRSLLRTARYCIPVSSCVTRV